MDQSLDQSTDQPIRQSITNEGHKDDISESTKE